jgi:hypothetical protein
VLRFPPPRSIDPDRPRDAPGPAGAFDDTDDLAQYEQDHEVDVRRRMRINVIALVAVTLLVGFGVWIADTIAIMEKNQDCVLQGRVNCAPVELPPPNR